MGNSSPGPAGMQCDREREKISRRVVKSFMIMINLFFKHICEILFYIKRHFMVDRIFSDSFSIDFEKLH